MGAIDFAVSSSSGESSKCQNEIIQDLALEILPADRIQDAGSRYRKTTGKIAGFRVALDVFPAKHPFSQR
jgi:hypothetical protein